MDGKSPAEASKPTEIREPGESMSLSGHVYSVLKSKLGKCWPAVAAETERKKGGLSIVLRRNGRREAGREAERRT